MSSGFNLKKTKKTKKTYVRNVGIFSQLITFLFLFYTTCCETAAAAGGAAQFSVTYKLTPALPRHPSLTILTFSHCDLRLSLTDARLLALALMKAGGS